jgi:hypothetical protein
MSSQGEFSGGSPSRRGERRGRSVSGRPTRNTVLAGFRSGSSLFVSYDGSDDEDVNTPAGEFVCSSRCGIRYTVRSLSKALEQDTLMLLTLRILIP